MQKSLCMPRMSARGRVQRCFVAACIMMGAFGLSLAGGPQSSSKEPVSNEEYRIGVGDVLQILVWKEPEASLPETMVQTDGKISVPLIGEVAWLACRSPSCRLR